jgi:hypothetical protein
VSLRAAIAASGAACAALLLAGVGGLVAESGGRQPVAVTHPAAPTTPGPGDTGSTVPSTTATTVPAGVTGSGGSGGTGPGATDQATLQTDLLVANDLGGYYTSIPADSHAHLAASGCLAPLGEPAPGASRAVTYLRGPFGPLLPDINEQLTSYPTVAQAQQVWSSLSRTLAGCTSTPLSLAGGQATATLAPATVPALGDQAAVAQGPFTLGAVRGSATVAVVRMTTTVLVFTYADKVPPSLAILGSPQSTLRAAVGKASP